MEAFKSLIQAPMIQEILETILTKLRPFRTLPEPSKHFAWIQEPPGNFKNLQKNLDELEQLL
jgi:hypothetical protein